tara:strand:- start:597 stop:866 length:270 start_codon:yes stop_codon:yes gene_type:complete
MAAIRHRQDNQAVVTHHQLVNQVVAINHLSASLVAVTPQVRLVAAIIQIIINKPSTPDSRRPHFSAAIAALITINRHHTMLPAVRFYKQ